MESQEAQYGRKHEYNSEQLKMSLETNGSINYSTSTTFNLIYKKIRQGLF